MYEAFYGLKEKPFSILPDPDLIYWGRMHSMAFGFTVAPREGRSFEFEELFYKADHTETRIAFLSLFRIGQAMRANMFS